MVCIYMTDEKSISKKTYLFTGENTYSLIKELSRWKTLFMEKNGNDSVFSFNRENRDYAQIKQIIFGWWFFVTTKLVILYGIPLDTEKSNSIKAEEVEKLAEDIMNYSIPKEVLLICVSYKPDKRWRFYKRMDKDNATIKSFSLLNERELPNFVREEARDLELSSESIETLIKKVWNDQFRLSSEIDKLRYWKKYYWQEISPKIVENVCFGMIDEDVFKLLDLILTDSQSAIWFINSLQESWQDWNAINWSFARWLRNYLLVLDYAEHWITDSKQIAGELKQNPRAISNIIRKLPQLQKNKNLIQNLFKSLVDVDFEIKNGISQPNNYFLTIKRVLLQW